jgi:hypothetical protein
VTNRRHRDFQKIESNQSLLVIDIPPTKLTNFEKQTNNMSHNMNNKTKTPFCTVCHAAGLDETAYTSHYVRDRPGGVVVCPTLLKVECRYCHKTGHTPKHCPVIKSREERKAKIAKRNEDKMAPKPKKKIEMQKPKPAKKQNSNAFAALASDSSDDEDVVTCCSKRVVAKTKHQEFPALGGKEAVQVQTTPGSSWAAIVTKASPKPPVKKASVASDSSTAKKEKSNHGFRMKSWADSDSEYDDCFSIDSWDDDFELEE